MSQIWNCFNRKRQLPREVKVHCDMHCRRKVIKNERWCYISEQWTIVMYIMIQLPTTILYLRLPSTTQLDLLNIDDGLFWGEGNLAPLEGLLDGAWCQEDLVEFFECYRTLVLNASHTFFRSNTYCDPWSLAWTDKMYLLERSPTRL